MSGEQQTRGRARPARKSTIDIRALLTNRKYIKETSYLLPRWAKIRVLTMMEHLRRDRTDPRSPGGEEASGPLPEMTGVELVREINWRIGTLPPQDAEAISRLLHRLTRGRAARRIRQDRGVAPAAPITGRAGR